MPTLDQTAASAPKHKIAVLGGRADQFRQWAFAHEMKLYITAQRAESERWVGFWVDRFEGLIGIHFDEIVLMDGFDLELLNQLLRYNVLIRAKGPKSKVA